MLFHSLTFALLMAMTCLVYWTRRGLAGRLWTLLVASFVFYASWSPPFLLLLCVSIGTDWWVGRSMVRWPGWKRPLLLVSLSVNLGILGVFKYTDFVLGSAAGFLQALGFSAWQPEPLGIVLPLGISFYTFQTISYSIDVYRGQVQPIRSLLTFAVYVSFFPQLIAGPIVRAGWFGPQLGSLRHTDADEVYRGLNRIGVGLIKKVILADWLAALVEPVFDSPLRYSGLSNLVALYAYAFQIFFDFSGYCDIALGCARILGFKLPENFDRPYLAGSIATFWRRWHMTLSRWLRDYLYIPLGGNREGGWRTGRNLLVTMLLGGLWHGASWNFVLWGALHGLYLLGGRILARRAARSARSWWRRGLAVVVTFNLVCLAWIFFRAETFTHAGAMLAALGGLFTEASPAEALAALCLSPVLLAAYATATATARWVRAHAPLRWWDEASTGLAYGAVLVLLSVIPGPAAEFIYFQF